MINKGYKYMQCAPKKIRNFRKYGMTFFSKLLLNSKISCISTSLKKGIGILSHVRKNLQIYRSVNIYKTASCS